tara:strand:+ start:2528 stop:4465 length:1938 start_codon:yes stop_codon:yes gene_type:complete
MVLPNYTYVKKGDIELPDEKPIISKSIGEKCTINMAKEYGIYDDDNKWDNSIISENIVDKLQYYDDEKKKSYNFCIKHSDDNIYKNCALKEKNIWLVNDGNKCTINKNITEAPLGFEKVNIANIDDLEKPDGIDYIIKLADTSKSICNTRWYDWFTISDFHNGNIYENASNGEKDICYTPCEYDYIPDDKEKDKCISRSKYKFGEVAKTFTFTPFALIILLGSDKDTLKELYKKTINDKDKIINYEKKQNYKDIKYDIEINHELHKEIINNDTLIDDLLLEVINQMKITINTDIITKNIDDTNIIPIIDINKNINLNPTEAYNDKNILLTAYNIANKLSIFLNTNDKKINKNYEEWKKNLKEISGNNINSWQFNKQLLLLQAACKCCFGEPNKNNTKYKYIKTYKTYINTKLSKLTDNNIIIKENLNFPDISQEQIIKSYDLEDITNNPVDRNGLSEEKQTILQDEIGKAKIKAAQKEKEENLRKEKNRTQHHDIIKKTSDKLNLKIIDNIFSTNLLVFINLFIVLLVIVIFLYFMILIIHLNWNSFAIYINTILYGFYWCFLNLKQWIYLICGIVVYKKLDIIKTHQTFLNWEIKYNEITYKYPNIISNTKKIILLWFPLILIIGYFIITYLKIITAIKINPFS